MFLGLSYFRGDNYFRINNLFDDSGLFPGEITGIDEDMPERPINPDCAVGLSRKAANRRA